MFTLGVFSPIRMTFDNYSISIFWNKNVFWCVRCRKSFIRQKLYLQFKNGSSKLISILINAINHSFAYFMGHDMLFEEKMFVKKFVYTLQVWKQKHSSSLNYTKTCLSHRKHLVQIAWILSTVNFLKRWKYFKISTVRIIICVCEIVNFNDNTSRNTILSVERRTKRKKNWEESAK